MHDPGLVELRNHPEYLLLLEAYRECAQSIRAANPEFDGWLPRLNSLDGIASEGLSRAHGRLICFGYLSFQLGDRTEGMKYQVSPEALRLLDHEPPRAAEDADQDADGELSRSA